MNRIDRVIPVRRDARSSAAAAVPLPRNAGSYLVQVSLDPAEGNYTAQRVSATLAITKAATVVTLGNLSQTFGAVTPVTATSSAALGGSIALSYGGSPVLPQAVGSYAVAATVSDPNYEGSASGALVIAPASANSIAANGSIAASAVSGAGLPGTQPSVRIPDGTNPVAGVAVSFSLLSGGGSLSGASVNTDANGIATLGGWTLGASPGPQSVRAMAAGISGHARASLRRWRSRTHVGCHRSGGSLSRGGRQPANRGLRHECQAAPGRVLVPPRVTVPLPRSGASSSAASVAAAVAAIGENPLVCGVCGRTRLRGLIVYAAARSLRRIGPCANAPRSTPPAPPIPVVSCT